MRALVFVGGDKCAGDDCACGKEKEEEEEEFWLMCGVVAVSVLKRSGCGLGGGTC